MNFPTSPLTFQLLGKGTQQNLLLVGSHILFSISHSLLNKEKQISLPDKDITPTTPR